MFKSLNGKDLIPPQLDRVRIEGNLSKQSQDTPCGLTAG